ncbi:MAG: right-handed parallel beta-helix repeat-containing protein [Myxococcota bacterium]
MTIEDCEVHDTGDVAVRFNDGGAAYEGIRILRNHIYRTNDTGEGMYLGCNRNGCQLFDSLIEGNYVHTTDQPSVDQGDGIELKEGSYNNIIRDNVIHDTNFPCILTYSTMGNGPPNIIERNVMWNCGDHAIQSAADAIIRNNIILSANADGIAMQPHQSGTPSNLRVVHNTILHPSGRAISLRGIDGEVIIANNALYSPSEAFFVNGGDNGLTFVANVGTGAVNGTGSAGLLAGGDLASDFLMASYSGAAPNNVFPAPGSPLIGAGDPAYRADDDFNGTPRTGAPDVGAYAFAVGGNPGWTLGEGFKDDAPVAPPPDGGTPPDASVGDGSAGGDGGGGATSDSDGGCSAGPGPVSDGLLVAFVGLLALRRRR